MSGGGACAATTLYCNPGDGSGEGRAPVHLTLTTILAVIVTEEEAGRAGSTTNRPAGGGQGYPVLLNVEPHSTNGCL